MGKKTIEANVYETELRQTQNVLRKVQKLLRDPKLQKPHLQKCSGIPEVEDIITRRAHGEFPTPLHEILAIDRILETAVDPAVKRWGRQRCKILRRRLPK